MENKATFFECEACYKSVTLRSDMYLFTNLSKKYKSPGKNSVLLQREN